MRFDDITDRLTNNTSSGHLNDVEERQFPPLDVDHLGVAQPQLVTKDILIIVFMFLLWGYSLLLTYRAWYKLLHAGGEEGSNMWR